MSWCLWRELNPHIRKDRGILRPKQMKDGWHHNHPFFFFKYLLRLNKLKNSSLATVGWSWKEFGYDGHKMGTDYGRD
jgi:hypothetical protein